MSFGIAITRSTDGRTRPRRWGLSKSSQPRAPRGRTRTSNGSLDPFAGVHGSRHRPERSRAPPAVEGLRRVLHGISHASGASQGHPGPACGRTTVRRVRRCDSAGQRPPSSLRTSRRVAPAHRSQCRPAENRRAGERRAAAHPDRADAHFVAACKHDSVPTYSRGGWMWQSDGVATRQRTSLLAPSFW
jgi:hypothetical protein